MADAAAGQSEAVQQQEVVAAVQEELMKDVASLEAADAALNELATDAALDEIAAEMAVNEIGKNTTLLYTVVHPTNFLNINLAPLAKSWLGQKK